MGFLDRLDDRFVGAKGQPPDARRTNAWHWFGVAITLAVVTAGLLSSGTSGHNPVVWTLAGMGLGSLLFGGRRVAQGPPSATVHGPESDAQGAIPIGAESDIHNFASSIVEAEQQRK